MEFVAASQDGGIEAGAQNHLTSTAFPGGGVCVSSVCNPRGIVVSEAMGAETPVIASDTAACSATFGDRCGRYSPLVRAPRVVSAAARATGFHAGARARIGPGVK